MNDTHADDLDRFLDAVDSFEYWDLISVIEIWCKEAEPEPLIGETWPECRTALTQVHIAVQNMLTDAHAARQKWSVVYRPAWQYRAGLASISEARSRLSVALTTVHHALRICNQGISAYNRQKREDAVDVPWAALKEIRQLVEEVTVYAATSPDDAITEIDRVLRRSFNRK